ncbi:hypothetical protein AALP_AA2G085000 [Arabis alpina]|uniref:Protein kinase domain-containing protein n=1 Tax=Arabis alpina TaxID=50452 RepID=A0A087HG41_ARAAL|nr:hypothetical protein AALP_AA2G085000 [Arabis alpina]
MSSPYNIGDSVTTLSTSLTALTTIKPLISPNTENLKKVLEEGFELRANQDWSMCISSGGACGYNQSLSGFLCYCIDEQHNLTCGSGSENNGKISALCDQMFFHKNHQLVPSPSLPKCSSITICRKILQFQVCLLSLNRRRRKTQASQYRRKDLSISSYSSRETSRICFLSCLTKTSDEVRQQKLKALIPLKQYSYAQVKRITKSFVELVGKGGFGTVYRGTFGNGEDFINEVASMSKTSHVNIVSLLGFCSEGSKRTIIYEFVENGSLDKFMSSNTSMNTDWMALYGIALGVARGQEYLHYGCKTRIVHFDIKPPNVLVDKNLCPKVSDFGLAKLCEKKESTMSLLDTRGTIGYIAQEMISRVYGSVSHKSDVYSYGMLVLEMIGARNKTSTDNSASNPSSMLIENGISSEEEEISKKMTLVGLWCIQSWPTSRPPMNRVVEMMEGSLESLEVPPRPVLQEIPAAPFQESSSLTENISVYTEY